MTQRKTKTDDSNTFTDSNQRQQESELDKSLKTYNCQFGPRENVELIRWQALENKENVCTYVRRVVQEHVAEERRQT